jgi:hypothetical protein
VIAEFTKGWPQGYTFAQYVVKCFMGNKLIVVGLLTPFLSELSTIYFFFYLSCLQFSKMECAYNKDARVSTFNCAICVKKTLHSGRNDDIHVKLCLPSTQNQASCPTAQMEYHRLSALNYCLFNIFTATLHIWHPFPPPINRRTCHAVVTTDPLNMETLFINTFLSLFSGTKGSTISCITNNFPSLDIVEVLYVALIRSKLEYRII